MLEPEKISGRFFKNPLGIIGLFISLIYGMAALLLGTSIDTISENNQNTLVIFLVVFPPLIFFAFVYLVISHHRKLYGPSDFKDDKSFIEIVKQGEPIEFSALEETEVADFHEDLKIAESKTNLFNTETLSHNNDAAMDDHQTLDSSMTPKKSIIIMNELLTQGLVSQQLQSEYGGSIKSNISFKGRLGVNIQADILLEREGQPDIIIEIKRAVASGNFNRRVRELRTHTGRIVNQLSEDLLRNYEVMGVLVVDTESKDDFSAMKIELDGVSQKFSEKNISLKVYHLQVLEEHYGVSSNLIRMAIKQL